MVNRVILVGHCTQDTVQIATQGKAMARMGIATNSVWRDAGGERQEAADFHSVVLFGRLAEIALQYCGKGSRRVSRGAAAHRDFVDADGHRRQSCSQSGAAQSRLPCSRSSSSGHKLMETGGDKRVRAGILRSGNPPTK